jgi:hypothetical protein
LTKTERQSIQDWGGDAEIKALVILDAQAKALSRVKEVVEREAQHGLGFSDDDCDEIVAAVSEFETLVVSAKGRKRK